MCAWRRDRRRKKKNKKEKERNMAVANWVFAESTHVVGLKWNFAQWVVFGVVLRFEFHENRLSAFGHVGVEICPPIHLATIQQLIYYTRLYLYYHTSLQAVMITAVIDSHNRVWSAILLSFSDNQALQSRYCWLHFTVISTAAAVDAYCPH